MRKWITTTALIGMTGGFWLIFKAMAWAVPTCRRARTLRARYIVAKADRCGMPSPWPWIRLYWLAAPCSLVCVLFWSVVYMAAFQTVFGPIPKQEMAVDLQWFHWAVLPVPLAIFAWAGSLAWLLIETLWPDRAIDAVNGWLEKLRKPSARHIGGLGHQ